MPRDLLISPGPGEWQAALVEDGAAVELYVERGDVRAAGSIQLGRVLSRTRALASAFVEIGETRPGIAPLREAAAAGIALDEGTRVVVQVRREAQSDKGARLSVRLAGHDGAAIAARAAAFDPPAQLHPPPGLAAALAARVQPPPDRVLVDDRAELAALRGAFAAAETAFAEAAAWPIDLEAAFAEALMPSLGLGDDGSLHIDEMRAATLIDVDTGTPSGGSAAAAALAANLMAVRAIARQMRLRNLGGGIVVDFVGPGDGRDGRDARECVRQALAAAIAADPARPQVLGWTRLGHLELVRPRHGRSLAAAMLEPARSGERRRHAVALAHEALRAVWRAARAQPAANWRLAVAPSVEAALRGPAAAGLHALETRLGRTIEIVVADGDWGFDIVPV